MIGTVITAILMITFLQPASTVIDEEAYFGDILASDVKYYLYIGEPFAKAYLFGGNTTYISSEVFWYHVGHSSWFVYKFTSKTTR
jgi:hypothetical protein